MGRNQKPIALAAITMSLLICTGCKPFTHSLSVIQTSEENTNAAKLFQPIAIESVEEEVLYQSTMTRGAVEPAQAQAIKIGIVNDIHQDLNRELLQNTSERVNEQYYSIEFEWATPEENNATSYLNTVNHLISKGAKIIIIPNQAYEKELETIISNYPEIIFVTVDYYTKSTNVLGIKFREETAAFLAGVMAASQTQTGRIAYLAFEQDPSIESNYVAGFILGAQTVNPNIEVSEMYISNETNAQQIKAIVKTLYDEKHDIIFEAVGSLQHDVIEVAKNYQQSNDSVWVINSVVDLLEEGRLSNGKSVVLSSVLKNIEIATGNILDDVLTGEFMLGTQLILGLENDGVQVTLQNEQLSQETIALVNNYKEKIISGEIVVHATQEIEK